MNQLDFIPFESLINIIDGKFVNTGVKCYVNNYDDCKPKLFSRRTMSSNAKYSNVPDIILKFNTIFGFRKILLTKPNLSCRR